MSYCICIQKLSLESSTSNSSSSVDWFAHILCFKLNLLLKLIVWTDLFDVFFKGSCSDIIIPCELFILFDLFLTQQKIVIRTQTY